MSGGINDRLEKFESKLEREIRSIESEGLRIARLSFKLKYDSASIPGRTVDSISLELVPAYCRLGQYDKKPRKKILGSKTLYELVSPYLRKRGLVKAYEHPLKQIPTSIHLGKIVSTESTTPPRLKRGSCLYCTITDAQNVANSLREVVEIFETEVKSKYWKSEAHNGEALAISGMTQLSKLSYDGMRIWPENLDVYTSTSELATKAIKEMLA